MVKFVILAIFAIFVAQSFHIARKILVTFAIFAIFGDISGLESLEFCHILYFCDICHGCFQLAWKILVTFAIFSIFADISGPFLASFLCNSGILLHLVFLRCLSWVFLAKMKNPCYFCDFCDICRHFRALLGFFSL